MSNRLNLDFSLEFNDQRSEFVNKYIQLPEFQEKPLTDSELSTIADYLLYGRNRATGLNAVQDKDVRISSRAGTYDAKDNTESLDALMASDTFNENSISPFNQTHYTTPNTKFSRDAALALCANNPSMEAQFRDLWKRIDWLDLQVDLYKLINGKRTKPIREHLLRKFTDEQLAEARSIVSKWTARQCQKQNELLVELRNEQYTLRDFVTTVPTRHTPNVISIAPPTEWDVLPLGTLNNGFDFLFCGLETLHPGSFSEEQIARAVKWYWKKHDKSSSKFAIDFRDAESVYELFMMFFELKGAAEEASVESTLRDLLKTLEYYIGIAQLSEVHYDILHMKMEKIRNQDIALYVNKKYGKNYSANYISTIFRQKIIPQINEAVVRHEEIVGNLSFPEEFKTCSCCGRTYLRRTDYFVRKARSKDGLNSRCKLCDKLERLEKKEMKNV